MKKVSEATNSGPRKTNPSSGTGVMQKDRSTPTALTSVVQKNKNLLEFLDIRN